MQTIIVIRKSYTGGWQVVQRKGKADTVLAVCCGGALGRQIADAVAKAVAADDIVIEE